MFKGYYYFEHYDKDGNLIWSCEAPNSLADQGEQDVLDVYFRGATAPTIFYLRLTNTTPSDTSTLTALSAGEPSGNGYAPQEVERSSVGFPTLALDNGDYQLTSKEVTFSASGGSWGPVAHAFLATTSNNTGKLISYVALSQSRTLQAGESLKVTYKIKLQ